MQDEKRRMEKQGGRRGGRRKRRGVDFRVAGAIILTISSGRLLGFVMPSHTPMGPNDTKIGCR
jgi:hypothetical protein